MMKKAVVLLSGGIDSTVTAFLARKDIGKKGELYALTFRYGQLHSREISCAIQQSLTLGVKKHIVLPVALDMIGGSSLVGKGDIPTGERGQAMVQTFGIAYGPSKNANEIPSTWVPQRNAIFLAIGFGYAEVVGADLVYAGLNVIDYSGYPDCRPEFVEQLQRALNLASKQFVETGKGIGIVTPLSRRSKADIVKLGLDLGVDFSRTTSCYQGREKACGVCDSCRIRLKAFEEIGIFDSVEYEEVE